MNQRSFDILASSAQSYISALIDNYYGTYSGESMGAVSPVLSRRNIDTLALMAKQVIAALLENYYEDYYDRRLNNVG